MDGKIITPAALNGDVRTIPTIDKGLAIEGACADAKATGDRFGAQAAIIEEHGKKIADNAAAIQTLRAENGVQDTTLGEHKTLIEGNATKIAASENSIGELNRKLSEAEDAIDDLKEKATAGEESFAEVFERLNEQATDINDNFNMIVQEVKPELSKAQDDIEVLKNKFVTSINGIAPISTSITKSYTKYGVSCGVCTVWLEFQTDAPIIMSDALYGGLPLPKIGGYFSVYDTNQGTTHPLQLVVNGQSGECRIVPVFGGLPGLGRYVGNVTYIVADETTV